MVRTAIIPQPMSTPTAAGMIALVVAITLPTVAPIPACTSGITATHLWMKGSWATRRSWASASASKGTPTVHALIGAAPVSRVTWEVVVVSVVIVSSMLVFMPELPARPVPAVGRRDLQQKPW